MHDDERARLIGQYAEGYSVVAEAVAGAPAEELDRASAQGGWSGRQIVHHLADSETNSYVRLRKLLAEDRPTIHRYDEALWATALHYDRPIEASLAVLAAVRASSLELLGRASAADWAREGTHTESGRYTLEDWLRIYAAHARDHADQIRRARRGEG